MWLLNKRTRESIEGEIIPIEKGDFSKINKSKQFIFDWSIEKEYQIWKLIAVSTGEILGLMSTIDHPAELRVEIHVLELAKKHLGKDKLIDGVAGCLIAFAALISFQKGYFGFVSLKPKTRLIDHYQSKYGFRQYGRELGIEGQFSQKLILKYLEQ